MSQYVISNEIASHTQEYGDFCLMVNDLLVEQGGIAIVSRGLAGVSFGSISSVLSAISNATMRWSKPFELLRLTDFTKDRPDSLTFSGSISRSSAYRALKVLAEHNLVRRFTMRHSRDVYYSLNLPAVLHKIDECLKAMNGVSGYFARMRETLLNIQRDSRLLSFTDMVGLFANKCFEGIEEIKSILETAGGKVMGTLVSAVKGAKEFANQVAERHSSAKADQPFFKGDKANVTPALEYWHKQVKDSGFYPLYAATRTGKMRGMMKNWLIECQANGMNEQQIRAFIDEIVEKWVAIPQKDRDLPCVSSKGKPYTVRLDMYPNFDFFYAHRQSIVPLLDRTAAEGKTVDGQVRGNGQFTIF